jgi:hypothetical protein
MAAGEGTRWNGYLGTPKHLCSPAGEPLLTRLDRQVRERGVTDVTVFGPQEYAHHVHPDTAIITPAELADGDKWLGATKFANTMDHWSTTGRTVILFGDCWLEDETMDAILDHGRVEWVNWCRWGRSRVTGCPYGENFAVSFWPKHHDRYLRAINTAVKAHADGLIDRSGGWEVARAYAGATGADIRRYKQYPNMRHVGWGFSDDFDKPEDYDRWVERYRAAGRK